MTGPAQYWPFRNEAEKLFDDYLASISRPREYESPVGGSRPDFRVEGPAGPVICEVTAPRLKGPVPRIGSLNPYSHIRAAIENKSAQGAGARGLLPYVLVLRPDALRPYGPLAVLGAMFGDFAFSIPVVMPGTTRPSPDKAEVVVTRGGRIQAQLHTRFSALVVLHRLNPTEHEVAQRRRQRREPPQGVRAHPSLRHVIKFLRREGALRESLHRAGLYDPELLVPRVDVFHNPYASMPLSLDFFSGPYDRQWGAIPEGGAVGPIRMGEGTAILDSEPGFG